MDEWERALDDFEGNIEAIELALELLEMAPSSVGSIEPRALIAPHEPLPMAWAARADELLARAVVAQQQLAEVLDRATSPRRMARVSAPRLGRFDRSL